MQNKDNDMDPKPPEEKEIPIGFADDDLKDSRKAFEFESKYCEVAWGHIKKEIAYLLVILVVAPIIPAICHFAPSFGCPVSFSPVENYITAWFAGAFGGAIFSLKWVIHLIPKGYWHLDRRPWRIVTPIISGSLSLVFYIIISSSFITFFNPAAVSDLKSIFALGFLVGYFSDNAVAKLVEIAETVFGNNSLQRGK